MDSLVWPRESLPLYRRRPPAVGRALPISIGVRYETIKRAEQMPGRGGLLQRYGLSERTEKLRSWNRLAGVHCQNPLPLLHKDREREKRDEKKCLDELSYHKL